jgi:ABC-type nitrate/sulfonate/bicarbonate transport system ATPase subunit
VRSLLALVGLEHSAHAYPHQLSGGMRRRVQFVSAMAAEPDIMLLDEPFSALDEPTRVQVHQDVYTTLREFGTTALLVTHDIAEAISLSDRVLVLSRRPARVISHYDIPFGEQRSMLSLRRDSSFLELYSTIWASLSDIIVGPENVSASGSSVALPAAREGLESNGIGS